nr:class I SAM-dependent methyltransferase [Corynebacterium tapiri]
MDYINATTATDEHIERARTTAAEFGVQCPDEATGNLLSTLAATGRNAHTSGAVIVTPAAGLVGLHVLRGLNDRQTLTCIDPEAEHHHSARELFRAAGFTGSRSRFLPSRPLDVMGRLTNGAYHLVYLDVSGMDMVAAVRAAFPLLSVGGTIVLADSLLDGTIADHTRRDQDTLGARAADEYARELEDAVVSRIPLGAGLTLITRTA